MDADNVKLIVKAPNQRIDDTVVMCELAWTVGRVKEQLSQIYPGRPEKHEQKLIYSGRLLNDSSVLKEVLRRHNNCEDSSFTVHLVVCSPKKANQNSVSTKSSATVKSTQNSGSTGAARSSSETVVTPTNTNSASTTTMTTSTENRNIVQQQNPNLLTTTMPYGSLNDRQIAWMQQAYMHYLTQYMQLMAAQGIIQLPNNGIPGIINEPQPMGSNQGQDRTDQQQQQQQQQPQQQNQFPAVNAMIGENGEEAPALAFNRDWLDLFYMLSRILVLFSIVYFYSSPMRFLVVTFLGFAMYLYQGGFFRVQPMPVGAAGAAAAGRVAERNANPQVVNVAGGNHVNNNNNEDDEGENEDDDENNNNDDDNNRLDNERRARINSSASSRMEARTNANEDENEAERPGALAFTWTFFSSFFASLIPDQQNII